jgi:hypothetical protein
MNALNVMKKNLITVSAVLLALTLTACQNSAPQNTPQRQRSNVTAGIVNPTTGAVNTAMPWGAITNNMGSFPSQTLALLTGNASGIGYVSGNANDSSGTGILFRGQIDQSNGTGTVGIGVWDSNAAVTGDPFYWEMPVVQVVPTGQGATVTIQQGTAVFIFSGSFSGSMWIGTVNSQDPTSGNQTPIGNFQITACGIFSC